MVGVVNYDTSVCIYKLLHKSILWTRKYVDLAGMTHGTIVKLCLMGETIKICVYILCLYMKKKSNKIYLLLKSKMQFLSSFTEILK